MFNYRQLYYFLNVAKTGGITRAAEQLHLTPQTISGQLSELEHSLGTELLHRRGRRLELTDAGKMALSHAEEIFEIGVQLEEALRNRSEAGESKLRIGIADVVPKPIAHRLLAPVYALPDPLRLICQEGKLEQLFAGLAIQKLDMVISDRPLTSEIGIKGYNHELGESPVAFCATPELASQHRETFPDSLDGAPVLLPSEGTSLRGVLTRWFRTRNMRPHIVGEFDDTALMKFFAKEGIGLCPVPAAVIEEASSQYGLELIGQIQGLSIRFFLISLERRITHPALLAITQNARHQLFAQTVSQPGP